MTDYSVFPDDTPKPEDDGACDHLLGAESPRLALPSTSGVQVDLREATKALTVIYCYPKTGRPDVDLPEGWDQIPGARGCTPQTCGYRDECAQFEALGAAVYGLSVQGTDYQKEMADRLAVPFEVLSDSEHEFAEAMRLPTFTAGGERLLKRVTLVFKDHKVQKFFYPIFPPGEDAERVLSYLQSVQG